jgi:hypothetical protein
MGVRHEMNFLSWFCAFFTVIAITFYMFQTIGGVLGNTVGTSFAGLTLWTFAMMLMAIWEDYRQLQQ